MREYDPVPGRLLPEVTPEVAPAKPGPEWIWNYETPARAQVLAEAMTQQNREGRQAAGTPRRRFYANGRTVYAEPMD